KLAASSAGKVATEHLDGAEDLTMRIHEALTACIAGDFALGLQLAQQILAEHPEDLQARLIRGQAYAGLGQQSDAIAEFMGIAHSHPEEPDAFFHLGTLFLSLNELEKALKYFQSVYRLDPTYSLVKENIANIERKILESKPHKPGAKGS
ncbi:MAG TPA: tetratricopeptide repeat protein, partial [Candidatus Ozemobacteraceae bacterium]|nr:tetratricopeptide repeat protein [Candidatus Ozemobacteraceae bacterium]